jgi:hypothetical protein
MFRYKISLIVLLCFSCGVYGQTNTDECECVPFYLCVNGTINTNGVGVIDIRYINVIIISSSINILSF